MPSPEPPSLTRPDYLTGDEREAYAAYVDALYTGGMSIRAIARYTGRGYGVIHSLLTEHGTAKRSEGRPMGFAVHPKAEGTEEMIEVLELKPSGQWGKIRD